MIEHRNMPKNIILLVIDSLRYDSIGYSEDTRFQKYMGLTTLPDTPTLDAMASNGAFFSRAYTTSSNVAASHAAMFTSKYPAEHQIETLIGSSLPNNIPNITTYLANTGYYTVHATDFDFVFKENKLNQGAQFIFSQNDTRLLDLLKRKGNGYFLFFHIGDTHEPYLRSFVDRGNYDIYRKTYKELKHKYRIPESEAGFNNAFQRAKREKGAYYRSVPRWVSDDFSTLKMAMQMEDDYLQSIHKCYQEGVNQLDQGRLSRFFDTLKKSNLFEDTLLIITSDYGEGYTPPKRFGHEYDLNDGVLHVPFIISYPNKIPSGIKIDKPINHLDILPTVLDVVGIPYNHNSFRGSSVKSLCYENSPFPSDRGLYSEHWKMQTRIVDGENRTEKMLVQRIMQTEKYKFIIQGRDFAYDDSVLAFVNPNMSFEQFISSANHRFMGLTHPKILEQWFQTILKRHEGDSPDILAEIIALARQTFGVNRYKIQQNRRLRSYIADRLHRYWHAGKLHVTALAKDLFEAYFLDFPTEAVLEKLAVLIRSQCRTVEDIISLFEQIGSPEPRYVLYDLSQDPFESVNLFQTGLPVALERDVLAMEVMLIEMYQQGRKISTTEKSNILEDEISSLRLEAIG